MNTHPTTDPGSAPDRAGPGDHAGPAAGTDRSDRGSDWSADWSALTRDIVFDRIWSRPGLTTRERRLVTVALLAASGEEPAARFHLRAGLDEGIDADDFYELVAHTAVYAGWATGGRGIGWLRSVVAGSEADR
ncbi:carboxymuconolactone decarboxylase family protein [Streptomyces sp. NBC_01754]|uniref:carboxymuconolactone decarboxylase family protein n=1 Tax=Streptomyces sp. NBC_01754 TaxID=2975930 RepID=UPI002DD950DB|nr:carboxymuconolactone decarboxylase family protein [Streptomyces sp. NBC_01754]WSC94624.1 carboxymuconolactone decarboxylase family protein [Streptomyces sp. NBC_01754]